MAPSDLSKLFRQCLHQRIKDTDFVDLVRLTSKSSSVTSKHIVANLLNCAFNFCLENDPLISAYLQNLVVEGLVTSSDVLTALILHWKKKRKLAASELDDCIQTSTQLVNDLSILTTTTSVTETETRRCIILSSRWLQALARLAGEAQGKEGGRQFNTLAEAVGLLLVSYLSPVVGNVVLAAVEKSKDDQANSALQQAVETCMDTYPNISMQLIERMQKYPGLLNASHDQPGADNQVMEMAALEFEANINDAQIVPTRVATQVLLQCLLSTGATIDDAAICAYLSNRYSGSNTLMFSDLLFASFDAMTKGHDASREEYKAQCQVYLHNKLPNILSFVAQLSSFEAVPTEQLLMELWNDISTTGDEGTLAVARRFLQVCALHHLIMSQSVSTLIGGDVASTSLKGLFPKDALVEQVNANAARGPRLVDELAKNDGNAGAISYAIMDIMHKYCQTKQAAQLKDMASALVRKPATINTVALFIRPALFLTPFCNMLDDWNWSEIHGESQPVYEEFGSVLLLIAAFQNRLNLQDTDLGLFRKEGFLASYLSSGHAELDLSLLSDDQQKHIGDWVNALYMADGLSDDLTSSCSAKEFYMLIPTILKQSVAAVKAGKLSEDTLKAGLEYLLEPFLLPSLLAAFAWLTSMAEIDPKNALMIAQVLAKPPGSSEASEIHRSIMAMSRDLLQKSTCQHSDQPEVKQIFTLLAEFGSFSICDTITEADLTLWSGEEGGILSTLQRSITGLLAIPSQNLFRPTLAMATAQLRGPLAVAQAIVVLLLQFSGSHDFHQLLDLVATLIVSINGAGLSLRNAVQIFHGRVGSMVKKGDNLRAEALVHLTRRVEMYGTALTPQAMNMEQNLMPLTGVDIANINLDAVPVADIGSEQQLQSTEQQDTMASDDMDQMLKEAAAMGGVDQIDTNLNDTDMFDFTTDNYDELANLDDLDLNMFS